jgi:diguanylate cyclase (GGDEF)-like protein
MIALETPQRPERALIRMNWGVLLVLLCGFSAEKLSPTLWGGMVLCVLVGLLVNLRTRRSVLKRPQKAMPWTPLIPWTTLALVYVLLPMSTVALFFLYPLLASFLISNTLVAVVALITGILLALLPPVGTMTFLDTLPALGLVLLWAGLTSHHWRNSSHHIRRLQSLAATDGLTGLINRRQFNQQLYSEMARARRHGSPLSLALFDIDNFKSVNDHYGHPTGDKMLKELGLLISQNVRENDIPARYGGEEFALILPETRLNEATEILERLRKLVEVAVFCLPDTPLTATVSVGVVQLNPGEDTVFDFLEHADNAMYAAKRQGKNRVTMAASSVNHPESSNA